MLNFINKMCTYKRWHHSNGGVGNFGMYGEFMELEEGDKGKRKVPPHGITYQLKLYVPLNFIVW